MDCNLLNELNHMAESIESYSWIPGNAEEEEEDMAEWLTCR